MQAIEFQAKIHNGIITLPAHCQTWFEKPVKVILLAEEPVETRNPVAILEEVTRICTEVNEPDLDLEEIYRQREQAHEREVA